MAKDPLYDVPEQPVSAGMIRYIAKSVFPKGEDSWPDRSSEFSLG